MLIKVNFCNILQHFATFLYATFLKKYAIKKCKLDEVASISLVYNISLKFLLAGGVVMMPPLILHTNVVMEVENVCKNSKR